MNNKSWVRVFIFLLVLLQVVDIQAQKNTFDAKLNWKPNLIYKISDDFTLEKLFFDDAINDFDFAELPVFFAKIPVDGFFSSCELSIFNEQFVSVSEKDKSLISVELLNSKPQTKVRCVSENKKYYALVEILPFVNSGGTVQKLLTFTYTITPAYETGRITKDYTYKSNSVLSTGLWYRFPVDESGLYKLTFSDLQAFGFTGSSISSALISVFGNGTGMLSETNGDPRPDDLLEIPVRIYDGGDGTFDNGDYLVFYARSPHSVQFDATSKTFSHSYNIYSDYSYYYVCLSGVGEHKRVAVSADTPQSFSQTVSDYLTYQFYETDAVNLALTGREWFGDLFDVTTQRTYSFFIPNIKPQTARLTVKVANAASSSISSSFSVSVNSANLGSIAMTGTSGATAKMFTKTFNFSPTQADLSVSLTFSRSSSTIKAYLDWISIQALCNLSLYGGQTLFNNGNYLEASADSKYIISGANVTTEVWDVTDLSNTVQLPGTLNGSQYEFLSNDREYKEFVVFDGSAFKSVGNGEMVSNQNLHSAESQVDMIIVAHPDFVNQAENLASYRRQNQHLTVKVVTPQQVYNEFSSGSQDPVAIRDYMKMIYEKSAGQYPKYLLLFGRPSYDYRGRVSGTALYVPNWQRANREVISESSYRCNDDFFGILDDGEGAGSWGMVDVAVGRFPTSSYDQANLAVTLSQNYSARVNLVPNGSTLISNLADWRNVVTFVADDGDNNAYLESSESCAEEVQRTNSNINIEKIYCDAYPQVSNSGGQRYPDVNAAINDRMGRGALFFTYTGHSGKDGWAHERILEFSDINNWKNTYNQPVMMTMSCDFGWYDRPSISPAEACFFNTQGGAAALITTSRVAFGGSNDGYAKKLFAKAFTLLNGKARTVGELNKQAKNDYGGNMDGISMIYVLGDPSMPLALPQYAVVTDSVNGKSLSAMTDTLKALSQVVLKGHLVDENGALLQNFNGNIYTSIFDKKVTTTTLSNDPDESPATEFDVQKSILFKGNNTVKDGRFEVKFIIPNDINYTYGNGKISYYARSANADASGNCSQIIIGGNSGSSFSDKEGPQIDLYLNDESFVYNGVTNQNPVLIVKLQDELGINTTGNGIGHDLVAILDNNNESQIVLNDHYEAVQDSFNQGTVRYQLSNLEVGSHKLKVRAWDILNNVSEKELEFVVASDEKFELEHVLNYPNPFTTKTAFYFEHNHPGESMDVLVQIFTISGHIVKTISTSQFMTGTRSEPIYWDGRDDFGDKLGRGTYIYRLKVRLSDGTKAEKIEKIVIL